MLLINELSIVIIRRAICYIWLQYAGGEEEESEFENYTNKLSLPRDIVTLPNSLSDPAETHKIFHSLATEFQD